MFKKILSLSLACLLCLGVASPASAATIETVDTEIVSEETIMPREFVRTYEDYYTINGSYVTVVDDPNWDIFDDTRVTVALTDTQGPTKCTVVLYYKEDSATSWTWGGSGTVVVGGAACTFSIPENYTFKVMAKATEGYSGNATIQVSLK